MEQKTNPLGLKVWSSNLNYISEALLLYKQGFCDYIELYTVPDSFDSSASRWKETGIPIEIHGPHIKSGMNLSLKEKRIGNMELMVEVFRFADYFQSSSIILHPGVKGSIKEVIYQLREIDDKRIVIENMPLLAIDGKSSCVGHSPLEIKQILDEVECGFCLDIGHAIYSANYLKIDKIMVLKEYLELNPSRIHFMDGDWDGLIDSHLNLGKGSFSLEHIFSLIPTLIPISLETRKISLTHLDDFRADVDILRGW